MWLKLDAQCPSKCICSCQLLLWSLCIVEITRKMVEGCLSLQLFLLHQQTWSGRLTCTVSGAWPEPNFWQDHVFLRQVGKFSMLGREGLLFMLSVHFMWTSLAFLKRVSDMVLSSRQKCSCHSAHKICMGRRGPLSFLPVFWCRSGAQMLLSFRS